MMNIKRTVTLIQSLILILPFFFTVKKKDFHHKTFIFLLNVKENKIFIIKKKLLIPLNIKLLQVGNYILLEIVLH